MNKKTHVLQIGQKLARVHILARQRQTGVDLF